MTEVNPVIKAVAKRLCWDESKCTEPHDCPCEDTESCMGWNSWVPEAEACVDALYSALEKEGWQVVPREPDEEMIDSGLNEYAINGPYESPFGRDGSFACKYRAMLAAAPKPPGAG